MKSLTLRFVDGDFVVTAPDIQPVTFKSRHAAKDWCADHHPGSPVMEVGQGARNGRLGRRGRPSGTEVAPSLTPTSADPRCVGHLQEGVTSI